MYVYRDALAECGRLIGSNPVRPRRDRWNEEFVWIPDDGSEVGNPLPGAPGKPRRVESAMVLRLEGPGGPPGLDVSAEWNASAPTPWPATRT